MWVSLASITVILSAIISSRRCGAPGINQRLLLSSSGRETIADLIALAVAQELVQLHPITGSIIGGHLALLLGDLFHLDGMGPHQMPQLPGAGATLKLREHVERLQESARKAGRNHQIILWRHLLEVLLLHSVLLWDAPVLRKFLGEHSGGTPSIIYTSSS
jgi:hypothetical protein